MRAAAGDNAAEDPYLRLVAEPILNRQSARFDADWLLIELVRRRALAIRPKRVKELYALRSATPHGSASTEEHVRILRAGPEICGLAHSAIVATSDDPNLLGL
jgi:hypothetical protein